MNHVLVTGASGFLGSLLLQRLSQQSVRTRAFVRPGNGEPVQADQIVTGNVTDESAVRRAAEGVDVIFHLAARLHRTTPTADYEAVNVGGTAVVSAAAAAAGAKVVFFSTINVYGPSEGRILDEQSDCRPRDLYAVTKRQAEKIVLNDPRNTVLRLAAVYGRRMKGNYVRLVRALRRGIFVPIGSGDNRRTMVHESDAIEAALLAARSSAAAGETFNVTDGDVHTVRDIIGAISEALGRKAPGFTLPVTPVRTVAAGLDSVLAIGGRSARFKPELEKYLEDIAVSGERIQERLGFRPRIDLRTGWKLALTPDA